MADRQPILRATGVAAGYGGRAIVENIDLTLNGGELLGLLGANGAGKSTLMKALTGQLPPIAGKVEVNGINIAEAPERAKAELGLAVDISEVPLPLTGRQYLVLVASIRGCDASDWPNGDLLTILGLEPWIDRAIAVYSLGTRMKISIAASLLGSPPLLIFDESLNGLDPVAAYAVKGVLTDLAATACHAIILATHVVETIPTICTSAIFLAGGSVRRRWSKHDLVQARRSPGSFEASVIGALTTP